MALKLLVHLVAHVVEQVNDFLIIPLPFALFELEPRCDLIQWLCEICNLAHPLQFAETVQDLGLHLRPLRFVVQQEELNLPDQLLFTLVNRFLLHLKGSLHVSQQEICVFQLLISLFRPLFNHSVKVAGRVSSWQKGDVDAYLVTSAS